MGWFWLAIPQLYLAQIFVQPFWPAIRQITPTELLIAVAMIDIYRMKGKPCCAMPSPINGEK